MQLASDLFAEACGAIWGAQWRKPAAAAFGVAERTVYRWADGSSAIPPGIWPELAAQARAHARDLGRIAVALDTAGSRAA